MNSPIPRSPWKTGIFIVTIIIIKRREQLMSTYCQLIVPYVARILRSHDHFITPAKFYVIPKIHKTPMVGRPIAASHLYITKPISIFVDELLKGS